MKVRIIDLTGELIAEAELRQLVGDWRNPQAIIFSNRVFLWSFQAGTFEYFREVKAEKITDIQTLRAETSLEPIGD